MNAAKETICDYLVCDQKRCDQLFTQVETGVVLREWLQAETDFRLFVAAFERHMQTEETVLFPAIEKAMHDSGAAIAMLRVEHARIRGLIERIYDALHRYDPIDFLLHAETFSLLMQQHSLKEEDMLYPLLDRVLGEHAAEVIHAMREKAGSTLQ